MPIQTNIRTMTRTIFRVATEELVITREDILAAMLEYDDTYRITENDSGQKYAVKYDGKSYPPKRVLSLAIKKPTSSFKGGKGKTGANQVFRNLGFEVLNVKSNTSASSLKFESSFDPSRIHAPIPNVQDLIAKLFFQKWMNLHTNFFSLEDGIYPGVYVLAYSDKNLEGEQVREEEVFYVGMTHAGIRKRLNQFIKGIEENKHHSGARTFYRKYAHEVPYSKLASKKTFFGAFVSIPCIVDKKKRTPTDLRKMGEVARLELYVMARIKEKIQREPELNKK